MKPGSLEDHFLFTMQFIQMMEDFQTVDDECPACGHSSRSNTICLRDECDFMLFIDMGKLHPSVIPWVNARKEALS
jgi:hypothetical protein